MAKAAPRSGDCAAALPLGTALRDSVDTVETADDDSDWLNETDEYALMLPSSAEVRKHGLVRRDWRPALRDYRAAEFGCTLIMFGLALFFALIPVHQRPIPSIEARVEPAMTVWARDPTLNARKLPEHVPTWANITFGAGIPIATNLFMNYWLPRVWNVRRIPHDTRDFLLALMQSTSMAELLTEFTKNMTGRLRPCFYDMCGWQYSVVWDGITNLCTDPAGEKEARKSFPSGHASFSWSTMLLLTLYLLGRSRLNCENRSESMLRGGRKTLKLFLCFVPSFVAAWVAVTRSIDNWHHYADILAGSIIGAVSACVAYGFNYGWIFSSKMAGIPLQECHARRKVLSTSEANTSQSISLENLKASASRDDFMQLHDGYIFIRPDLG